MSIHANDFWERHGMQLGFMSAIVPDIPFGEVMRLASDLDYQCVEIMCWPVGRPDRPYGGVTHIDLESLTDTIIDEIKQTVADTGVSISGLGYYPNPLSAKRDESEVAIQQIYRLLDAARAIGVPLVNTFLGRDPSLSVDAQWPRLLEVWKPIVQRADELGVTIAIENCPMLWSESWPGGFNIFNSPKIWRRTFEDFPSLKMNFDPSHLFWTFIDPVTAIKEFGDRIVHVHAKDARIEEDLLQENGILNPVGWHTPKLPGLGDGDWGAIFGALSDCQFQGPVCAEVEDPAFEGSFANRKRALIQCRRYLGQYVVST